MRRRLWSATATLVFGGLVVAPPSLEAQQLPSGVTQEMVEEGRQVFRDAGFCYTCHGQAGNGMQGLGADLTDRDWLHIDGSYGAIVELVRGGVSANRSTSGVPMPPMGGARLTSEQVRAVAAYVWSLSRRN